MGFGLTNRVAGRIALVSASVAVAYLRWMIVRKPVLTIAEAGFTYHQARLPAAWITLNSWSSLY